MLICLELYLAVLVKKHPLCIGRSPDVAFSVLAEALYIFSFQDMVVGGMWERADSIVCSQKESVTGALYAA